MAPRGLLERTFQSPASLPNLVGGFKLAAKPSVRVAAHGVADHQGSMDAIALRAFEKAEFVTCRAGRYAGQHRADDLAMRTPRALYGAKRRTGQ